MFLGLQPAMYARARDDAQVVRIHFLLSDNAFFHHQDQNFQQRLAQSPLFRPGSGCRAQTFRSELPSAALPVRGHDAACGARTGCAVGSDEGPEPRLASPSPVTETVSGVASSG